MAHTGTVTVRIEVDTSRLERALHRAVYVLLRWRWQPSDPNPFPKLHLFRSPRRSNR